ncbi:MAG: DUF2079 domain-containing protein [Bacteroidota bacterium]|nr:DUF2079 domain-containing protein [Bacteroidota bacterium]
MKRKEITYLLIICIFFAFVYSLISLVNHYLYRTSALDLGMFNNAIYDFAHFRNNTFKLDPWGNFKNYFGDHFSPITFFYVPFYYIFGSYSLLIIQILSIIAGGLGIYFYCKYNTTNRALPYIFMVHFFSIWGIYSALSFDFHNNVIAAMLVPWFVYFWEKDNKKITVLLFILIIICKENMALWMFFIIMGLMIKDKFNKVLINPLYQLSLLLFSIIYFYVVVKLVMPGFQGATELGQLKRYVILGNNANEMFLTILKRPGYIFSLLFRSSINGEIYSGIKSELHYMVLFSGGFAFIKKPHYLVMLIPIYMQKMLSTDFALWGINYQYSIEFVPVLTLALFDFVNDFKNIRTQKILSLVFLLITFGATISKIDKRKSIWYNSTNQRFYSKKHYQTDLNIKEINQALELIPANAAVSAHYSIVPHISFRDKIYHFPYVNDAEYIVLFRTSEGYYPIDEKSYNEKIKFYEKSPEWIRLYDKSNLLIFRKMKLN